MVLALVLVGLFVWGLVTIAGKRHQQPAVSQSQPEPVPATVPQSINELPELPQERWEYIDELENQEVIVDVPEREVGPPKVMQCGSFRQLADAERLRAQIAMAGLESQVRTTEGQTGTASSDSRALRNKTRSRSRAPQARTCPHSQLHDLELGITYLLNFTNSSS